MIVPENLKPRDYIAGLIILGYIAHQIINQDTMIPATVMLIVGYYFARRDEPDHTSEDKNETI